jgi:hypothetical protein
MPLNRRWRSLDIFGSKENLNKAGSDQKLHEKTERTLYDKIDPRCPNQPGHHLSLKIPFRKRLSSFGSKDDSSPLPGSKKESSEPPDPGAGTTGLVQRCVIIQKDERGYGFTVSGDNPVHVASVKTGTVVSLTTRRENKTALF